MDYTLMIDPNTKDLVFDDGGLMATVDGDDAYTQNVRLTLDTWRGEFLLDETHGTDYARILMQDDPDLTTGEIEEIINDAILQEPQVSLVSTISATMEPGRILTISFAGELQSGSAISLEELTQHG